MYAADNNFEERKNRSGWDSKKKSLFFVSQSKDIFKFVYVKDSSVSIVTYYGLDGPGIISRW